MELVTEDTVVNGAVEFNFFAVKLKIVVVIHRTLVHIPMALAFARGVVQTSTLSKAMLKFRLL